MKRAKKWMQFGFPEIYLAGYVLLVGEAVLLSIDVSLGLFLSLGLAIYFGIRLGERTSKRIRSISLNVNKQTRLISIALIPFSLFLIGIILAYLVVNGISEESRLKLIERYGAIFQILTIGFTPVVLQAIANARRIKGKEKLLIALYGLLPLLVGSRSIFLMFVFGLIVVLASRMKSFPFFKVLFGGVAIFIFLVAVTFFRGYGDGNLDTAAWALYNRIFLINSINAAQIVEYYQATRGYLLGGSIIYDLRSLAPGPDLAFSGQVTAILRPDLLGHVGITPTILGEAFANFGPASMIVGVLFWFLSFVVNVIIPKDRAIGFSVWLKIQLFWTITGGVGPFIVLKLPMILFFLFLFRFMIEVTRKKEVAQFL